MTRRLPMGTNRTVLTTILAALASLPHPCTEARAETDAKRIGLMSSTGVNGTAVLEAIAWVIASNGCTVIRRDEIADIAQGVAPGAEGPERIRWMGAKLHLRAVIQAHTEARGPRLTTKITVRDGADGGLVLQTVISATGGKSGLVWAIHETFWRQLAGVIERI